VAGFLTAKTGWEKNATALDCAVVNRTVKCLESTTRTASLRIQLQGAGRPGTNESDRAAVQDFSTSAAFTVVPSQK